MTNILQVVALGAKVTILMLPLMRDPSIGGVWAGMSQMTNTMGTNIVEGGLGYLVYKAPPFPTTQTVTYTWREWGDISMSTGTVTVVVMPPVAPPGKLKIP